MDVAGVDGCPGGWLVVWADAGHQLRVLSAFVVADFHEVLRRTQQCKAIAIDIPIGLSDNNRRKPDIEARRALIPLRHNSVFPSPIRPALINEGYRDACSISQRLHVDCKMISKQTYALMPKIRQVDDVMSPELQQRVREVHPEICFWALNGHRPLENAKRSDAGEFERLRLLAKVFANNPADIDVPIRAARDDVYDACAAAWTAARIARGEEECLPLDPDIDCRGLRMEIVY